VKYRDGHFILFGVFADQARDLERAGDSTPQPSATDNVFRRLTTSPANHARPVLEPSSRAREEGSGIKSDAPRRR
jgi:hypothetical protein